MFFYRPLLLNLNWIAEIGLDLYLFESKPLKTNSLRLSNQKTRWGIHAKRAVLDKQTVLIGTYTIDPRSANLNSELMIVCKNNSAFAKPERFQDKLFEIRVSAVF